MGQAEGRFYRLIHSKFSPENAPYYVKTNNPYAAGVPDVYYSGMRADLWVEYKFMPRPPKRSFKPMLTALQIDWLRGREQEGRNCWVIVGVKGGRGLIIREMELLGQSLPATFYARNEMTSAEIALSIAALTGPRACVHTESETPEAS